MDYDTETYQRAWELPSTQALLPARAAGLTVRGIIMAVLLTAWRIGLTAIDVLGKNLAAASFKLGMERGWPESSHIMTDHHIAHRLPVPGPDTSSLRYEVARSAYHRAILVADRIADAIMARIDADRYSADEMYDIEAALYTRHTQVPHRLDR